MVSEEKTQSKTVSISIPLEMYEWLETHNISRSKVFQDEVERLMNANENKMSPTLLLSTIMGICFSVSLMLVSIGAIRYIGLFSSVIMLLLGVVLLFVTLMTVIKVKKKDDALPR